MQYNNFTKKFIKHEKNGDLNSLHLLIYIYKAIEINHQLTNNRLTFYFKSLINR